jgi:hypothetical protein
MFFHTSLKQALTRSLQLQLQQTRTRRLGRLLRSKGRRKRKMERKGGK